MGQQKVTYLHHSLLSFFEREIGRRATDDERRILVTLQRMGGGEADVALAVLVAEIGRHNLRGIEGGLARRQQTPLARKPNPPPSYMKRAGLFPLVIGAFVGVILGMAFVNEGPSSIMDSCLGGRGRIEATPSGERYCLPVDSAGNMIKWRVP